MTAAVDHAVCVQEDGFAALHFLPSSGEVMFACARLCGRVVAFNVATAAIVRTFDLPQPACSLAVCPDGERFVSGGASGGVFVVDTESGACEELHGHMHAVQSLSFTEPLRVLSAGGATMRLWDLTSLVLRPT